MQLIFSITAWTFLYGFGLFVLVFPFLRALRGLKTGFQVAIPLVVGIGALFLYGDVPGTVFYFSVLLFYLAFYRFLRNQLYHAFLIIRSLDLSSGKALLPNKREVVTLAENSLLKGQEPC